MITLYQFQFTDDLRSYAAAARALELSRRRERGPTAQQPGENSHRATRRLERQVDGFKSVGSAQRFLSAHTANNKTHQAFRATAMDTRRAAVTAV